MDILEKVSAICEKKQIALAFCVAICRKWLYNGYNCDCGVLHMSGEQGNRVFAMPGVVMLLCMLFVFIACGCNGQYPPAILPIETTEATVPETTVAEQPSETTVVTQPTETTCPTESTEQTDPTQVVEPTDPTQVVEPTDPTQPTSAPTDNMPAQTIPPYVHLPLAPEQTEPPETTPPPTSAPPPPETTAPTQPPEPFVQPDMPGAVPEGPRVDSSYFDDVVFIGDSISLKLTWYESAMNVLGNAQFLTEGSLGSGNALWQVSDASRHPKYNGQKMLLRESVPLTGAKKMYIMLGMNDIGVYGVPGAVSNLVTLVNAIRANAPDNQVFIQSMTPTTSTSYLRHNRHTIENIVSYNKALLQVCLDNGWHFVNVASVMYDEYGYLRMDYCSDPGGMGIHFSNAGCAAWVEYLYTHTVP